MTCVVLECVTAWSPSHLSIWLVRKCTDYLWKDAGKGAGMTVFKSALKVDLLLRMTGAECTREGTGRRRRPGTTQASWASHERYEQIQVRKLFTPTDHCLERGLHFFFFFSSPAPYLKANGFPDWQIPGLCWHLRTRRKINKNFSMCSHDGGSSKATWPRSGWFSPGGCKAW